MFMLCYWVLLLAGFRPATIFAGDLWNKTARYFLRYHRRSKGGLTSGEVSKGLFIGRSLCFRNRAIIFINHCMAERCVHKV